VDAIDQMVGLLAKILNDPSSRKVSIAEFEEYLDNVEIRRAVPRNVLDILGDLAHDLSFYVADPAMRAQDPSYFGDERLVKEVKLCLGLLSEAGVIIPDGVQLGSK
jgi:hypothetical protein